MFKVGSYYQSEDGAMQVPELDDSCNFDGWLTLSLLSCRVFTNIFRYFFLDTVFLFTTISINIWWFPHASSERHWTAW